MSRPAVGSWGGELYERLLPLAYADSSYGWAMLHYCQTIGLLAQEIRDLVRDTPEYPGWSSIVDADRVPFAAARWLGQFVGLRIPEIGRVTDRLNMFQNPSPEVATSSVYVGLAGSVSASTDHDGVSGVKSYRLQCTSTSTAQFFFSRYNGSYFPVKPFHMFAVSAAFKKVSGATNRTLQWEMWWLDARGDLIDSTAGATFTTSTSWVRHGLVGVAPAGTTHMVVLLKMNATGNVGDAYLVDSVLVEESDTWGDFFWGDYSECYWTGIRYQSESAHTALEEEDVWLARVRAQIKDAPGWKRGTPAAMVAAVKNTLAGSQTVRLIERFDPGDPDGSEGNSAYHVTVETYEAETPSPATTLRAMMSQKPGGIVLHHNMISGQTYDQLEAGHPDYDSVQLDYTDYDQARRDVPI